MEHRCSERWPIVIPVSIHRKEHPVVIGKTRNISLEGMFIETVSAHFDQNTCLEVELNTKLDHQSRRLRIPAVVARSSEQGIGIMFRSLSAESERALRNLIYKLRHGYEPAEAPLSATR